MQNFIIRKGEWETREFGDQTLDLSDVVSGTVHFYMELGKWGGRRELDNDVIIKI